MAEAPLGNVDFLQAPGDPISIETAYRRVTAPIGTGFELWTRVTHNDAASIRLALDADENNFVVPMINGRKDGGSGRVICKISPRDVRGWGALVPLSPLPASCHHQTDRRRLLNPAFASYSIQQSVEFSIALPR